MEIKKYKKKKSGTVVEMVHWPLTEAEAIEFCGDKKICTYNKEAGKTRIFLMGEHIEEFREKECIVKYDNGHVEIWSDSSFERTWEPLEDSSPEADIRTKDVDKKPKKSFINHYIKFYQEKSHLANEIVALKVNLNSQKCKEEIARLFEDSEYDFIIEKDNVLFRIKNYTGAWTEAWNGFYIGREANGRMWAATRDYIPDYFIESRESYANTCDCLSSYIKQYSEKNECWSIVDAVYFDYDDNASIDAAKILFDTCPGFKYFEDENSFNVAQGNGPWVIVNHDSYIIRTQNNTIQVSSAKYFNERYTLVENNKVKKEEHKEEPMKNIGKEYVNKTTNEHAHAIQWPCSEEAMIGFCSLDKVMFVGSGNNQRCFILKYDGTPVEVSKNDYVLKRYCGHDTEECLENWPEASFKLGWKEFQENERFEDVEIELVEPSFEILEQNDLFEHIERAGRTCYKSEAKGEPEKFVEMLVKNGHMSALEHGTVYLELPGKEWYDYFYHNPYSDVTYNSEQGITSVTTNYRVIRELPQYAQDYLMSNKVYQGLNTEPRITVKFVCSRQVAQQFTRHRRDSFSMESQRYCNYSKDKFGNRITFIKPINYDIWGVLRQNALKNTLKISEAAYMTLIDYGCKPEEARNVLPNCTKTELIMTGFLSDWKWFFEHRCKDAKYGKPDEEASRLAEPLRDEFIKRGYLHE